MDILDLEHALARLSASLIPGQRFMLGLVGAPGAGKSTVAAQLMAALPGRAVVVPMDGYHLANSELARMGYADGKGAPHTFDSAGYVAMLAACGVAPQMRSCTRPEFRREIEEAVAGAIAVPPEVELVVTEGNCLLLDEGHWAGVRAQRDAVWYVDMDDEERRA